jgi:hypothetical protein
MARYWWRNLSWKLGYADGKTERPHKCPWWADKMLYSLAYLQGKRVEIPKIVR